MESNVEEDSMSVVSDQAELQAGNRNTTPTQGIIDDTKSIPEEISQLPTSAADPEMEQEQDLDNTDCNDDEELSEKKSKTAGGFTGRGVTLQMLLEDNILQAKEGAMSLEYMGQKFNGDLLADGKIFSAEVQEVFSSPSAWALRCKKIVNPDQKYGCGWSAVRYCGRPLDVYKNQWMKKRRLEQVNDNLTPDDCNTSTHEASGNEEKPSFIVVPGDLRQLVKHETLGNRPTIDDSNLLVETISFSSAGKLQPFLISLHTSALITMDVHCSLTRSEVVGYLAGSWDVNSNTLTIKQAFPCLSRLADEKRGQAIEIKIAKEMEAADVSLVGWYHSHTSSPPQPTVQDIDAQLEYQLKLKGTGDQGYRPCVGIISSPYYREDETQTPAPATCYWVSPPTEARPQELGKPMAMQYNVVYDSSVKEEVIPKIDACLKFYENAPDRIYFEDNWTDEITILEKLKSMIKSNLRDEDDIAVLDLLDNFMNSRNAKKLKVDLLPETHCGVETIATDSNTTDIKAAEVCV